MHRDIFTTNDFAANDFAANNRAANIDPQAEQVMLMPRSLRAAIPSSWAPRCEAARRRYWSCEPAEGRNSAPSLRVRNSTRCALDAGADAGVDCRAAAGATGVAAAGAAGDAAGAAPAEPEFVVVGTDSRRQLP